MSKLTANSTTFQMLGGDLSLDFCNHMMRLTKYASTRDQLTIVLSWMQQAELLSKEDFDRAILLLENKSEFVRAFIQKVICLQDTIYNIFLSLSEGISPNQKDIRILNEHIQDTYGHLMITVTEKGFNWKWDKPKTLCDCVWPVVRSAAELLTSDRVSRVRLCPGERCGWLFLDTTKNRSRKWCDMRDCGNVAKARTYRKRRNSTKTTKTNS